MLNFHIIINGYLTAVFVFVGVILNIISIIVLKNSFKKIRTIKRRTSTEHEQNVLSSNNFSKLPSENKLYYPQQNTTTSKLIRKTNTLINLPSQSTAISPIIITCVTRPKIYIYFTWIILCDTGLLIFAFLMYGAPTIGGQEYEYLNAPWTPITYTFCNTTMVASVWLMCALMYDRYRALSPNLTVALSLKSVREKDIHKMLALVFSSALIYTLPRFFELKVVYQEVEYNNSFTNYVFGENQAQFVPIPVQTDLVRNSFYMIGYRVVGGFLFYSLIPYILLFGASTKISIELHKTAKRRQKMFSNSSPRYRISAGTSESNKILLAVMAKFLISRLMPTILDVVECLLGADSFNNDYYYATLFIDISNFIIVLASTTNFFIFNCYKTLFTNVFYKKSVNKHCNLQIYN